MTQLPSEFEITKPPVEEGSEPAYEQFNAPKPVSYDDHVVYLGLDVATKRDTCALVGVAPDDTFDSWTV